MEFTYHDKLSVFSYGGKFTAGGIVRYTLAANVTPVSTTLEVKPFPDPVDMGGQQ
jgi:hypothetical protein